MKANIILAMFVIVLFGCVKDEDKVKIQTINGLKIYKNKNLITNSEMKFDLKQILEINGINSDSLMNFLSPLGLCIDSKENVFILDVKSSSIKKFDQEGDFVKSIGRQGMGPGEMMYPNNILLLNDTLFVLTSTSQIVSFDNDGNYIKTTKISSIPQIIKSNNSTMVGLVQKQEMKEDGLYIGSEVVVFDNNFNEIKTLDQKMFKITTNDIQINYLDLIIPFCISKDEIFVSSNSEDIYKINVYDLKGNIIYSIEKEYVKTKFSEEESLEFNNMITKAKFPSKYRPKYKKAINNLFVDYENVLFVSSSINRKVNDKNVYFDIFKDKTYLNTKEINIYEGSDYFSFENLLYFRNGKMYFLSNSNDANLKIYEYKLNP